MLDLSKLRYDISKVSAKEPVISYFPELADHKEFSNPKHNDLLQICILATDENSPFVKSERDDYEKRLVKILEYLNIVDKSMLKHLVKGDNPIYEAMVTKYLMQCDSLAYIMWYDKLRMFHQVGEILRSPIDADTDMNKRVTLDKQRELIYSTLLDYEAQIFTDVPTRMKVRKQVAKLIQPAEQYSQEKQVI